MTPVAVYKPAIKMKAPVKMKKQKNKPVVPNTIKHTSNNPPYRISASTSKMAKKLFVIKFMKMNK